MDYFPRIFSQNDLFWLDNLMPDSKKKQDGKRKNMKKRLSENESEEDFKVIEAPLKNMAVIKERLPHFLSGFFFQDGFARSSIIKRDSYLVAKANGDAKSLTIDMDFAKVGLLASKESNL